MEARLKVDTLLREVLKENGQSIHLYFQPKAGFQLQYPCIVYSETKIRNNHANNRVYIQHPFYTVTVMGIVVMDKAPDSKIKAAVSVLPKCTYDRSFVSDGLYHTVFTIYI